jgi:hypothetical protein
MIMAYALLTLVALAFGLLLHFLAGRRGASQPLWFGLGVVLGPIAVPLLFLVPRRGP